MTSVRKPAAPTDLGARGRAFWRSTLNTFELSEVELELLKECCRLLDECEALRVAVKRDGTTVAGSTGHTRVPVARRKPSASATEVDGLVPRWVWVFERADWWDADEQPPAGEMAHWRDRVTMNPHTSIEAEIGVWRWCQARRRWRQASEAWCAARGFSYCRTVLGWRRPAPNESATGSPWGDAGRPAREPRGTAQGPHSPGGGKVNGGPA